MPANKPLKIESGPEMLTVQRTVDGQLASFVRYGVLYTVEIRCDAPSDPRCLDDNYVLGLVGKTRPWSWARPPGPKPDWEARPCASPRSC